MTFNGRIVQTIALPFAEITKDENGIIRVHYLEGSSIDIPQKKQLFRAYSDITGGERSLFVFKAQNHVNFSKEAKEYSVRVELKQPFLAVAVVAHNLAYQLIADFYFKFYKPKVAYKVFKSEDKAVEWLLQYRADFNAGTLPEPGSKKLSSPSHWSATLAEPQAAARNSRSDGHQPILRSSSRASVSARLAEASTSACCAGSRVGKVRMLEARGTPSGRSAPTRTKRRRVSR